ncbi:MAG: SUMF1/EgtB/PvdO family nonheme iron enzyme, partial [Anaerolineales bacterium]|nr:SUMF1/EgtB/PvdO family nonheme iron enzyme [Anaerolineales bacterium]
GHQVTLPSEAEWEKGARGTGRNLYPWGDAFDPDRANHQGSGRGGPSPVGGYPAGASPDGLLDMSGNVWEWTRSLWGDGKKTFGYKYDPQDGREELTRGDNWARILRGGSWYSEPAALRCAARAGLGPGFGNDGLGFRVCVSPFPATSGR